MNEINDKSDGSLIRSIREGDDSAAGDLFRRYELKLSGLAYRGLAKELSGRLDPADITQSVFRTFFRRITDGQYEVPPGDTIWRLLSVIALNKIRSVGAYHRAAKRDIRRSAAVDDLTSLSDAVAGSEDALRILHLTIHEALAKLTATQQQIVQLRLEEHDVASISTKTGLSKRSVERVLHGFRALLQKAIDEEARDA